MSKTKKNINKKHEEEHKLRVFEAFAGIGAQNTALRRAGINYEVVGISEWFINALKAYDAINCEAGFDEEIPSYVKQIEYLEKFTFSRDSVTPIKDITKLSKKDIEELYIVNHKTKNYGSITEINGKELPDIDLLIYSFPCQDLSTGGKTKGMEKGSGTRSGLLWEIERILKELQKENRLPEYLLLENVKTIYAQSNKKAFDEWLSFLESIGYSNGTHLTLNAIKFGVPQHRQRAFIISHLGEPIDDSSLATYSVPYRRACTMLKTDYTNPILKQEADAAQLNDTPSRQYMWSVNHKDVSTCPHVNTITCNMDRSNTAAMFKYSGPKGDTYRLLTIREAFIFMGFNEDEYERVKNLGLSYRQMNKLIGNSIVVDVLEQIFVTLFSDKYELGDSNHE